MIEVSAPSAFGISPKYDMEIWNNYLNSCCRIWWRKCFLPKFDAPQSHLGRVGVRRRLEALSAETKRLEGIYQRKVESLEELKKSVLQKAFEGEI
jgi:hypothetical protein